MSVHELAAGIRIDAPPTWARQDELVQLRQENALKGAPPYDGVILMSYGEVLWAIQHEGWSVEQVPLDLNHLPLTGEIDAGGKFRPDFRGVTLRNVNLTGARLTGADFTAARLEYSDFTHADLRGANFSQARIEHANFSFARLRWVNFVGAFMRGANLSDVDMRRSFMDASTRFVEVIFNDHTYFGDVGWNGLPLSRVDWEQARRLGDEYAIHHPNEDDPQEDKVLTYQRAVQAYLTLASELRDQGLTDAASRYRRRGLQLQRRMRMMVRRFPFRYTHWVASLAMDVMSGYGESPGRIVGAYLVTVTTFAGVYFGLTNYLPGQSALSIAQAALLSFVSFHGRGFFPYSGALSGVVSGVATVEAVCGVFIEAVLIATLSRRFLNG